MAMLVSYVSEAAAMGTPRRELLDTLTERFALSFDDARLVLDRVPGGATRASSSNPTNEPNATKDPVAWTSYRLALGLPVAQEGLGPTPHEQAAALALIESAKQGDATRGTEDVGVALAVTGLAIRSTDADSVKLHVLLEAATSVSVAAESCISRLGGQRCAAAGSQEWVDGVQLATAARAIAEGFAARSQPELEERGYSLAGRIVTGLLGQSRALVGRAMLDTARCIQRNGDPARAADCANAVIADFRVLLDWFAHDDPLDEDRLAIEYLLAAIEFTIVVNGTTPELDALHRKTLRTLGVAPFDERRSPD